MKGKYPLTILLVCLFCGTVTAQTNDLMHNRDVTPESLIKALTPKTDATPSVGEADAKAEEQGSGPRMRQFKMVRDKPGASPSPGSNAIARPAPARASASLMITFETGSAELTQISRKILDSVAQALNSDKLATFKFNIEGHADPTGFADKNLKLSEERAIAVSQYLSSAHSVDAARLIAIGKGSSELLNHANPTAPENRRVRIVNISK
jgi:outer membrane protein OmpA-like peptidoglycan-associated protein